MPQRRSTFRQRVAGRVIRQSFPGLRDGIRPAPRGLRVPRGIHEKLEHGEISQIRLLGMRGRKTRSFDRFPTGITIWSEHPLLDYIVKGQLYIVSYCELQLLGNATEEDFEREGYIGYGDWRRAQMMRPELAKGGFFDHEMQSEIFQIRAYDIHSDRNDLAEDLLESTYGGLINGTDVEFHDWASERNENRKIKPKR